MALSQCHYIEKVLDKFKYMEFGIAKTPLDMSFALRKNEGESDSQLDYSRVLKCLMYIMNYTRPDIACVISKLSQYTINPNKTYWMEMKRVLEYLKYTQDYTLHYNKYPAILEGYSDVTWITGSNKVKSMSGYVFTIDGGVVSWKSSKQTCIVYSTMESEFITLDKAGEKAEWLRNFFEDIPYWPKPVAPVEFVGSYTNLPHVHGDRNQPHIAEIEKFELAIRKLLDEIGLEDENYIVVTLVPKTGGEFVTIESAEITLEAC
ncbi:hypothetical protein T459_01169 [Capsicum annuum]|uniref:Polyphenol oxidase C-terminal domain-containing protein n=1 Tax=Capsicum annuum TaxID=4072 RepID=A0A2G3AGD5_CAPAN|nr:hypothetical protein T459_01169 [Capsicum annuum]